MYEGLFVPHQRTVFERPLNSRAGVTLQLSYAPLRGGAGPRRLLAVYLLRYEVGDEEVGLRRERLDPAVFPQHGIGNKEPFPGLRDFLPNGVSVLA